MTFTPLLADATADETLQELNGRVDCIISNPPYVPESEPTTQPEVDRDPDRALYGGSADGMRIPELVIERAARLLRPGGYFVMEHDISQGAAVRASLVQEGFHAVETQPDLTGRPRFSVGTAGGAIMSGEQAEGRN
jgi:release factor glutamine methyltransferase